MKLICKNYYNKKNIRVHNKIIDIENTYTVYSTYTYMYMYSTCTYACIHVRLFIIFVTAKTRYIHIHTCTYIHKYILTSLFFCSLRKPKTCKFMKKADCRYFLNTHNFFSIKNSCKFRHNIEYL